MTDSSIEAISPKAVAAALSRVRTQRPLVQCITNDVVQEITANVLLAAGMSPAMVPAPEEAAAFAQFAADALLCNVGTPSEENSRGMKLAAATMSEAGKPWTLDPVGAGGTAWRDDLISDLIDLRPTVIRGNGSEILACAGFAHQYKGVDSLDSSRSALDAAKALAQRSGGIVCVSGETDYATDGTRVLAAVGGNVMATLGHRMLALRSDRGFRREGGGSARRHHRLLSVRETGRGNRGESLPGPGFLPRRLPRRALHSAARKLS